MDIVRFSYRSDSRTSKVIFAFLLALLAVLTVVWCQTDFLPGELRNFGFAWWCLILSATAISYGVSLIRPVTYESWIRNDTFGWSAPRCRPKHGDVPLNDITEVHVNPSERHFHLKIRGKYVRVPEQCVEDCIGIARELVAKQPAILLYVNGNQT
jgi:hypothetical protein